MDLHAINLQLFRSLGAGFTAQPTILVLAKGIASWSVFLLPALLLGLWWRWPDERNSFLAAAAAGLLALLLTEAIAALVPTPRPFVLGLSPVYLPHPPDGSFPSAHTSVILGVAAGLFLPQGKGRTGWGLCLGLIGLVTGWSRIYLGLHFPLDILGSAGVAVVSGTLLARFGTGWTAPIRRGLERLAQMMGTALAIPGRKTGPTPRG